MTLTFRMMEQSTTHDNPVKHNMRNESATEKMGCGEYKLRLKTPGCCLRSRSTCSSKVRKFEYLPRDKMRKEIDLPQKYSNNVHRNSQTPESTMEESKIKNQQVLAE